jgi:hypothetical protein
MLDAMGMYRFTKYSPTPTIIRVTTIFSNGMRSHPFRPRGKQSTAQSGSISLLARIAKGLPQI